LALEEIEDEDEKVMKDRKTLPTNSRHTLMSESEYLQCPQEGEEVHPNKKQIVMNHSQREKTKKRHLVDRFLLWRTNGSTTQDYQKK